MSVRASQEVADAGAPKDVPAAQVLDLKHLDHQTLGDPALRRDVLQLFVDETPRFIADLKAATDSGSWRMAVHTLKGVSLNLGAFRLAQLCRSFETAEAAGTQRQKQEAAEQIAGAILEARSAIADTLRPPPAAN